MAFGQVGSFTAILESFASAVGSGILLGGFVMGAFAFLSGQSREAPKARALTDGYAGGVLSILLVLADLIVRYAI